VTHTIPPSGVLVRQLFRHARAGCEVTQRIHQPEPLSPANPDSRPTCQSALSAI